MAHSSQPYRDEWGSCLNRLTAAQSSTLGMSWSYDSFGNRLQQTALAGYVPESLLSFSAGNNRADQHCHDGRGAHI